MTQLNFKEELPSSCPPPGSVDEALENVCRMLFHSPEDDEKNYKSHAELGIRTNGATPCDARSCSLFRFGDVAKAAMKIGAFKKRKVAILNIPKGSGRHTTNTKNGHINFWMADHFHPQSCVVQICDGPFDVEQAVTNG